MDKGHMTGCTLMAEGPQKGPTALAAEYKSIPRGSSAAAATRLLLYGVSCVSSFLVFRRVGVTKVSVAPPIERGRFGFHKIFLLIHVSVRLIASRAAEHT